MTQLINEPSNAIHQMLSGIVSTYPNQLNWIENTGIILMKELPDQVALISGGGSGHEPAHAGYVGDGMLQAAVSGPFFIPPDASEIFQAIQLADQGHGVLLIIKNFEADVEHFLKAEELAQAEGHKVNHIIVCDDCSVDTQTFEKRRRGVAGTVFIHKILGAAARLGYSLEQLVALGNQLTRQINTLGVAFSPPTKLGSDDTQYTLAHDEIYFGIGIHGEPGYRREIMQSSERLAQELVNKLKAHYKTAKDPHLAILVNGLGATPLMELFVFANDVYSLLDLADLNVSFKKLGNQLTSFDTRGISLTLLNLTDSKWLAWLEEPVDCFAW